MHEITLLGTGFIGSFYTTVLQGHRRRDRIGVVYSRSKERAESFAQQRGIPIHTTDLREATEHPSTGVVLIGLPNDLHEESVRLAARAGKAVLCTKPLGRNAAEAHRMLEEVERAGVFGGYLEDLVYTPKTLKALEAVRAGALGRILWTRSRETHPGPHSDWFFDNERAGGGALVDMGCHCIEIGRAFIGKNERPLEAMCWTDTQVHPIDAEDHAIALVRYAGGAVAQVEVSWTFRGGMDLRDEVSGTEGTIRLDHFLRTGFEMYTAVGRDGYVAEKAESDRGWLFPVGDEVHELGYVDMFTDVFEAIDANRPPMETFYDGYVVNAIMDACYRSAKSKRWESIEISDWRGDEVTEECGGAGSGASEEVVIKEERLPDGRLKRILRESSTGRIFERVEE